MPVYVGEIDRFVLELQRYAELENAVVAISSLTACGDRGAGVDDDTLYPSAGR
ncbi:hypothetical protein WDV93_11925 [Pantoea ananatis]